MRVCGSVLTVQEKLDSSCGSTTELHRIRDEDGIIISLEQQLHRDYTEYIDRSLME